MQIFGAMVKGTHGHLESRVEVCSCDKVYRNKPLLELLPGPCLGICMHKTIYYTKLAFIHLLFIKNILYIKYFSVLENFQTNEKDITN